MVTEPGCWKVVLGIYPQQTIASCIRLVIMSNIEVSDGNSVQKVSEEGEKQVSYSKIVHMDPILVSTPPRSPLRTTATGEASQATATASASPVANSYVPETVDISKIYKILVVGNAKCGKSSIISKYAFRNNIDGKYKTTIGADFVRKDVSIDIPNRGTIGVRLQLWDIAGQDRFQKLTRAYFNKARGVAIVCDVSREGTIEAIKSWKAEIDNWSDQANCQDIPVVLFANKADLLENPQDAFKTGAIMERSKFTAQILSSMIG
jgi:small GTP-binding protein